MGVKFMSVPVTALLRAGEGGWAVTVRPPSEAIPPDARVVAAELRTDPEDGSQQVELKIESSSYPADNGWRNRVPGRLLVSHPDGTWER
jgi:hypothetical protein